MSNALPTDSPVLDHVVYNVQYEMDAAAEQFAAAGYSLTERGFHTLGSINHLMILDSDYIELIGLPVGSPDKRGDIASAPFGLNGLVFKSDDVDVTYAHLQSLDMAGDPPRSFSRPVEVNGQTEQARFRTVAVRSGLFQGGRVYFCEHATPDLVWRNEWRQHANGAIAVDEFIVVAAQPENEAARYASLLGREARHGDTGFAIDLHGSKLVITGIGEYQDRFGAASAPFPDGAQAMFGALSIRCRPGGLATAEVALAGRGTWHHAAGRSVVRLDAFNAVAEFITV
jgi:hypothetical protein